jgi:hypothetical protein
LFILLFVIFLPGLFSQEIITGGKVYDKATNQVLTTVSVLDKTSLKGTTTDDTGGFKISLLPGIHNFEFSHIGYHRVDTSIQLTSNIEFLIYMDPVSVPLSEYTITAESQIDHVSSPQMGTFTLSKAEMKKLPSLLGEADPLKLLQLTPGVKAASYGGAGFFVRGGGTDQNLILYDNTIIYNPGHLLGMFSVFNPGVISDVSITKSGIPAQYGGKLSSVIKLNSYRGNKESLEVLGSVGLISSRISFSGPLFKQKGTFILGARKTYLGLIIEPIIRRTASSTSFLTKENNYDFYDFNAGATMKITDRDNLLFSAYLGRDVFKMSQAGIKQENFLNWGNTMVSLIWKHKFNDNAEWSTKGSWTTYEFNLSGSQSDYLFGLFSSVEDYSLKSEINLTYDRNHIGVGFELTEHNFIPNKIKAQAGDFNLKIGQYGAMNALEGGIFVNDEFNISSNFSFAAGFRFSFFDHHGPFTEIVRNELGQISDTLTYARGESIAFYCLPEPRLVFKYNITNNAAFKASYMRIAQYIHLATTSSASLPTDIWIPSTSNIKPLIGDQVSVGYFSNFSEKGFEFSTEIYYKKMQNQLEFLRGIVNISIDGNMENNVAIGFGQSYGAEFYLAKKKGKTTGWLSYTLSRTEKKFDEINAGNFYPAKYDGRHDVSLTVIRKFNEKWSGSAVFIYITGNAFTMPVGRYIIQGNVLNQYGEINSYRMPANHRLDISATRKITRWIKLESELIFSIYNVYNRANPYFIYYEVVGNVEKYSLKVKAFTVTLLPVIPSISWNFKF